jgi:hypothetical protein
MFEAEVAVTLLNRWLRHCRVQASSDSVELLREGGLAFEYQCGRLVRDTGAAPDLYEALVFADGSRAMRISSPSVSDWSFWSAFEPYGRAAGSDSGGVPEPSTAMARNADHARN